MLLLAGVGTRLVAALSGLLLLVFIAGVSQAWERGLAIDCGCFGGGGAVAADQTAYGWELARDAGFLMLAGWLVVRPGSYLVVGPDVGGARAGGGGRDRDDGGPTWVVPRAARLDPER